MPGLAARPTPNLKDKWLPFSLARTLWPARQGWICWGDTPTVKLSRSLRRTAPPPRHGGSLRGRVWALLYDNIYLQYHIVKSEFLTEITLGSCKMVRLPLSATKCSFSLLCGVTFMWKWGNGSGSCERRSFLLIHTFAYLRSRQDNGKRYVGFILH